MKKDYYWQLTTKSLNPKNLSTFPAIVPEVFTDPI